MDASISSGCNAIRYALRRTQVARVGELQSFVPADCLLASNETHRSDAEDLHFLTQIDAIGNGVTCGFMGTSFQACSKLPLLQIASRAVDKLQLLLRPAANSVTWHLACGFGKPQLTPITACRPERHRRPMLRWCLGCEGWDMQRRKVY